ncbi:cytochrome c3 family protein [Acaryochloris marina]|uniref:cytochrome c3 family protein n=1 Tax=Acaryochloris marina TaxID=155978 RepID=UPI001BAEC220|nr:cytochrome c3 family protein [Acaryochloris marina]QUY43626.1 cytochrome c3 family protein [Acaryochloris marina S15]
MKQVVLGGLLALLLWSGLTAPVAAVDNAQLQAINQSWSKSAHALAEVNCSSCHQPQSAKQVIQQPTHESCRSCHEGQVDTFLLGKHGIRLLEGQPALTPALAHLPMQAAVHDKQMNCNACHDAHSVKTLPASVDSCLTCHKDNHSLNYKNSRHAQLLQEEGVLPRPSTVSTTCATCHLPRQTSESGTVMVNHNNTYTLLPRDRMVKEVCMNCHGMEFAYNSMFDDDLVESNFARPPTLSLDTLKMVRTLETQRSGNATSK